MPDPAPVVGSKRVRGAVVWTVRYRVAGRVIVREFTSRDEARAFASAEKARGGG